MSRFALTALLSLTFAGAALATDIPLLNAGFEASPPGYNAPIPDWNGGGDFNHADTGMPAPPELGAQFGFLGNGPVFGAWQATGLTIDAGYTYTFDSWILVRNNGALPLGIGYRDGAGDLHVLATQLYGNTYPEWTHVPGVSYTADALSPGLGFELVVGYAGNPFGLVEGDTWFDNAHASFVPEPTALLLCGFGLLLRRR